MLHFLVLFIPICHIASGTSVLLHGCSCTFWFFLSFPQLFPHILSSTQVSIPADLHRIPTNNPCGFPSSFSFEDFPLSCTELLPNTMFLSEGTWATLWEVVVADTIMGSCSVSSFGVMVSGLWLLIELGPSIFLSWKMLGVSRWCGLVFSTFMAAFSPLSHQTAFVCFGTFWGGCERSLVQFRVDLGFGY